MITPAQFSLSPLVGVERAMGDFRRGLPVLVSSPDGQSVLAVAAELARPETVQAITNWSGAPPYLVLSHQRAVTLKIRLYTPEVVLLPQYGNGGWETAEAAKS
ncbi:MAG: hypothetical protein ABL951_15835, partial [Alphaproteobacteria bacterium]